MQSHAVRNQNPDTRPEVAVVERDDLPGVWTVEAIDTIADGDIYQALFIGPEAFVRAQEYARFKYGLQYRP